MLINNESIIEFDLANSQPTLLSLVLNNTIYNEGIDYFNGCKGIEDIKDCKSLKEVPLLCSELDKFHHLCSNGKLYQYFKSKLEMVEGYEMIDIDQVKTMFIAALYGSNDPRWKTTQMLNFVFPQINKYLREFKIFMRHFFDEAQGIEDHPYYEFLYSKDKGWKNSEDGAKDYLCISLQRLEANIFIDDILSHLMEREIIALPKHDSILCPESQADVVERIMKARLDERLGAGSYLLRRKAIHPS